MAFEHRNERIHAATYGAAHDVGQSRATIRIAMIALPPAIANESGFAGLRQVPGGKLQLRINIPRRAPRCVFSALQAVQIFQIVKLNTGRRCRSINDHFFIRAVINVVLSFATFAHNTVLVDEAEQLTAERLAALSALARLRGTTLMETAENLGIRAPAPI